MEVQNNPIGDDGVNRFFTAIRDGEVLETVNFSKCRICTCMWAGRLRVIVSLTELILSHNSIDDEAFVQLCDGLEGV